MRGVLFPSLLCLAICLHYATALWNQDVLSKGKTCEDLCQNVSNCNPMDEFKACKCFPRRNVRSWLYFNQLPIEPSVMCMMISSSAPKCCDFYKTSGSNIASKISNQSQEIEQFKQSLSNLKADMLKKLGEQDQKVDSLTQGWSSEPWKPFATELIEKSVGVPGNIAFSAYLGSNIYIGSFGVVTYNNVITNDGGGYDYRTGYFTCPEAGTYLFSFTIDTYSNEHTQVELEVNDTPSVGAYVYPLSSRYQQCGNTAFVKLTKGDVVSVKLAYHGEEYIRGSSSSRYATFSGFLVHE